MAVPFGFSVGDFVTIGKLIGQIVAELRQNGESPSNYQCILIELEALQRALNQLLALEPAQHELLQLTSIRATVFACQKPLQQFLDKISKFDHRLGAFNAGTQRWKGLPRRLEFRVMFKEDIKDLRSFLASHIETINLLLMTQAASSLSLAEKDRNHLASGLESKILAYRSLLEKTGDDVKLSLDHHTRIHDHLKQQEDVLGELGEKTEETRDRLRQQLDTLHEVQNITVQTQTQTRSLLSTTTNVLDRITSGFVTCHEISQQLARMIEICGSFSTEMCTAMRKILDLFSVIQTTLQQINRTLPLRCYLPIVRFTTALGENMALPYQLCQQWNTFKELLRVMFLGKPGNNRVVTGMYLIMNVHGGRTIPQNAWNHAVAQDDHLSMSIVLDDIMCPADTCPFPTCRASTAGAQVENGGRTCTECKRWSKVRGDRQSTLSSGTKLTTGKVETTWAGSAPENDIPRFMCGYTGENIELYRFVHIQRLEEQQAIGVDDEFPDF